MKKDKKNPPVEFTTPFVAKFPPDPDKRVMKWDANVPGFGLLITPQGAKSFILQYRFEGRPRRFTIGAPSDVLTLTQARNRAKDLQADIRHGIDPMASKIIRRQAMTVGALLDAYLGSAAYAGKSADTQDTDRGRANNHIRPLLGREIADKLTKDRVARARADIEAGKTARAKVPTGKPRGFSVVRGGEGAARKSIKLLATIYEWAKGEKLLTCDNPAADVAVGQDGQREQRLEIDQYGALLDALDALENQKQIAGPAAAAIRMIALTGARRGEVIGLRWRHVDLTIGRLVIDKHKTAKSSGKPRVINLSPQAAEIIERQERRQPDDLVFEPGRGEGGIDLRRPWRLARKTAGLPENFILHGLRHSIASHLAMSGAGAAEIMTALGHKQISTSQRYIHSIESERQALAAKAAAPIAAAMALRAARKGNTDA